MIEVFTIRFKLHTLSPGWFVAQMIGDPLSDGDAAHNWTVHAWWRGLASPTQ